MTGERARATRGGGPLRSIEEEENLDQEGKGTFTGYMTGGAARRTSRTNRHPREAWSQLCLTVFASKFLGYYAQAVCRCSHNKPKNARVACGRAPGGEKPISLTFPNMSSRALAALKCDSKMRNVVNYFHGWYALNARKYESPSEASGFGYYLAAGINPFRPRTRSSVETLAPLVVYTSGLGLLLALLATIGPIWEKQPSGRSRACAPVQRLRTMALRRKQR
jgi:hypothetical protein